MDPYFANQDERKGYYVNTAPHVCTPTAVKRTLVTLTYSSEEEGDFPVGHTADDPGGGGGGGGDGVSFKLGSNNPR